MTGRLKIANTVNRLAGRARPELVDLVAKVPRLKLAI
jgi:hypothetical protein